MKQNQFIFTLMAVSILALNTGAEARERNQKKQASHSENYDITYSQSAPTPESVATYTSPHTGRLAIGFSTISSTIPGSTAAITGIYDFSRVDLIQAFFSIPQTSRSSKSK
jgi:hypothetical protein